RARYYDPQVGRFISADPFQGLKPYPLSLHQYAYANADPVNFVDPTGFSPWRFSILLGIFSIGWLGTSYKFDKAMRAHFLVGFFATLAGVALVALIGIWRGGVMLSANLTFAMSATLAMSLAIGIYLETQVVGNTRGHFPSQAIQSAGAIMAFLLILLLGARFSPIAKWGGSAAAMYTYIVVGIVAGAGAVWCYQNRTCFGWI
ncbi:MAG: RHS repeat-associated core domain-containing protein, partial [bacterium]|nr:RHS repeat-associated core domain-containing protein [bacterium]